MDGLAFKGMIACPTAVWVQAAEVLFARVQHHHKR